MTTLVYVVVAVSVSCSGVSIGGVKMRSMWGGILLAVEVVVVEIISVVLKVRVVLASGILAVEMEVMVDVV